VTSRSYPILRLFPLYLLLFSTDNPCRINTKSKHQPSFPEPLLFIIPLLILSTLYHRHHEPIATPLSRTEMAAAFMLYFYGCAQLFYSPSWISLILCSMCFLVTSIVYILTNPLVNKIDWDIWHYIGMHIVPGVWASVVAFYNFPIFI
jgi:hypothetical protein